MLYKTKLGPFSFSFFKFLNRFGYTSLISYFKSVYYFPVLHFLHVTYFPARSRFPESLLFFFLVPVSLRFSIIRYLEEIHGNVFYCFGIKINVNIAFHTHHRFSLTWERYHNFPVSEPEQKHFNSTFQWY